MEESKLSAITQLRLIHKYQNGMSKYDNELQVLVNDQTRLMTKMKKAVHYIRTLKHVIRIQQCQHDMRAAHVHIPILLNVITSTSKKYKEMKKRITAYKRDNKLYLIIQ
uniref:Uncharacterized protein n=1 Tax=viral metagenome TaxID=1070528 RepID=A0A6C0CR70_9ZZZZ